jgi:aryl-alcohol dehydrogenase-like predicted oxidoreductase
MDSIVLGRTGLTVGVAGLGCGGSSRLGQGRGASIEESIGLVRAALDLGINYFDTAHAYGTEEIVGRALDGRRDAAVISTKVMVRPAKGPLLDAPLLRNAIETSLTNLRTETIDVFHLHGVLPDDYQYCIDELVPELLAMRARGAIRFLALSEAFVEDIRHEMLLEAVNDDCWDVAMVGFNILNPSARTRVLPDADVAAIGVEVMYAVRNAFSQPDVLRRLVAEAVARELVDPEGLDLDDPLGFLVYDGGASSVIDAAYRFARHEPGCHIVLTGTGSLDHLEANVRSINRPPLPDRDLTRLATLFGHLDIFNGN